MTDDSLDGFVESLSRHVDVVQSAFLGEVMVDG